MVRWGSSPARRPLAPILLRKFDDAVPVDGAGAISTDRPLEQIIPGAVAALKPPPHCPGDKISKLNSDAQVGWPQEKAFDERCNSPSMKQLLVMAS